MPHPQLEPLVEAHEGFVKALALNLAPVAGLADDITQQVFLEFIAKAGQWDLTRDLRPLLAQITRLVAARCWKDRARSLSPEMAQLAEHLRALSQDAEAAPFSAEEKEALRRCMQKLPEKSRRILTIHYFGAVASVDIAATMQMSADAVRRALFRIRAQLRKCIQSGLAGGAYD